IGKVSILRIFSAFLPACVLRDKHVFDVGIQFVQVDVCQQRAENTALWSTAVGAVVLPVLQIACLQSNPHEDDHPTLLNISCENCHQDFMIDVVETSANVAFDEPRRAFELVLQICQCCVTSASGAKAM